MSPRWCPTLAPHVRLAAEVVAHTRAEEEECQQRQLVVVERGEEPGYPEYEGIAAH